MQLDVYYLPQFVDPSELAGSVVVVVDQLRASTTICQAFASGAKAVLPCLEVDEAFQKARQFTRSEIVLGGERGGRRIEGFDLGNSPAEYTPDQVFGCTLLFTTTNGTRALNHARLAQRILVGATINRCAVIEEIASAERVTILCAGTGGNVTREDILAGGAMVDALQTRISAEEHHTNEWAEAAHREWQELLIAARAASYTPSEQFAQDLRDTQGGKNLLAIGHDFDLLFCAQLDALDVVPQLDPIDGQIRLA